MKAFIRMACIAALVTILGCGSNKPNTLANVALLYTVGAGSIPFRDFTFRPRVSSLPLRYLVFPPTLARLRSLFIRLRIFFMS